MAVSLETVVKQLEDSGIVAPSKLEHFVPPKAQPTSVEELVAELVKNNHLTKFQAAQVAAGKAKSLILGGYTIVDRTPRTDEGLALIERAHQLSPKDPFILDSLGWAFYRMGRLDEAERYLRAALEGRPDAEIAAHLGEVLWRKGERDQARAIWKAQLDSNPDNAVLKETVRRLAP